MPNLIKIG